MRARDEARRRVRKTRLSRRQNAAAGSGGTFFSDDELTAPGLSPRRARDMAHWPQGGEDGSLKWLAGLPCRRKVLVHINNPHPILREGALERAELSAAGVEVGHDGLEIEL